jgi:acyl-CoA synthetase (AMP-forming)/AMP-acid ligase II
MHMAHLIEWSAQRNRDRVAFVYEGREITYGEVDLRATRLAHGLRSLGVRKDERVAIIVSNRPEYAETEFAVAKSGGMRVPVLTTSTVGEIARLLRAAEPVVVVVSPDCVAACRSAVADLEVAPAIVVIESAEGGEADYEALITNAPEVPLDVRIDADDPYAIRFTGGTTGMPKGIVMSHRNMVTTVLNLVLNFPFQKSDVALNVHPLSHAAGMMMYAYWTVGARHVISPARSFNPQDFVATVEQHKVTSLFIIPTILNVLLDSDALDSGDVSSLSTIVYGGAPIPASRLEAGLQRFGPVFTQIYGSSEAPMTLTALSREDHVFEGEAPARIRSAGREALNVELRICDPDGNPVAPGDVGEIAARGDNTMVGYWKNDELTAKRRLGDWMRTGDMGYIDPDGYLFIVDRKEDMIITGGFNVWPAEIEDVIYRHPAVAEAAVFGVEDPKWGEAVTAAVVLREGATATEVELLAFIREQVTGYKMPKTLILRDSPIPKSAVGKALRRQVRDEFLEQTRGPGNE